MLGPTLLSIHNLRHFQRLMVDIRAAIVDDGWSSLEVRWPTLTLGRAASAERVSTEHA